MTRSLSNLYKQWFVQTDSTNTRIIDSNVILQQHLKQDLPQTQTPAQNVQEEEGGFSAGLVTGDPGQVIKAEPQIDYEAKAKAKAEEILAAAQQNADAILAQANEDAEEIRTSAKTQGYEEGRASAEQENEQLRVQLEESYRKKQGDLDSDYRDKREHMEQDLVDVIVTVFEKVFHIQFDDKKEILMQRKACAQGAGRGIRSERLSAGIQKGHRRDVYRASRTDCFREAPIFKKASGELFCRG